MMSNKLTCIVNADDFGADSNVNAAVLGCFKTGVISSASIMANMHGFEEACQMIHENKLNDYVGLHVVLTEGAPLSDNIKRLNRFCDKDGRFCLTRKTRLFHLDSVEKQAVCQEIQAQIEKCRQNGLRLTHLDSHHHVHEELGVISVIIPLMRKFGIPTIRIMCNTARTCSIHRKIYIIIYNFYLRYQRLNRTDYFGSVEEYMSFKSNVYDEMFEIMTHPVYKNNVIIDALNKKPLGTNVRLK